MKTLKELKTARDAAWDEYILLTQKEGHGYVGMAVGSTTYATGVAYKKYRELDAQVCEFQKMKLQSRKINPKKANRTATLWLYGYLGEEESLLIRYPDGRAVFEYRSLFNPNSSEWRESAWSGADIRMFIDSPADQYLTFIDYL